MIIFIFTILYQLSLNLNILILKIATNVTIIYYLLFIYFLYWHIILDYNIIKRILFSLYLEY